LNRLVTLSDKAQVVGRKEEQLRIRGLIPMAMTLSTFTAMILTALLVAAISSPARADGPFYLGTWKLDSAVVAPWADPKQKPDAAAMKALIGKAVTLTPAAISGPKMFACKGPHYKVSDFTADMLFQGAFEEMKNADKSVNPLKLAAALGFTGTAFKTLETGCDIDWHFVDQATAEVGLDDYVYTLKKQ
jgi:hypothetical protein